MKQAERSATSATPPVERSTSGTALPSAGALALAGYITGTVALAAGPLSGRGGPLLVLAALAAPLLVFVPRLLLRPELVLAGLVAVTVGNLGVVTGGLGVPGLAKATLAFATLTAVLGVRRGRLRTPSSPVYLALVCFLAAQCASLLFAEHRLPGLLQLADLLQGGWLLVVLVTLASAPSGIRILAGSAFVTMAALGALSLVNEFLLGNATDLLGLSQVPKEADEGGTTGRHSGPFYDANFWGRDVVLFLPLAFAALSGATRTSLRLLSAAAGLALLGAVYLTQSRGAYLAVAVALVFYLVLSGRRARRLLWLAPLLLGLLVSLPGVGSRLQTVTQVSQAGSGGGDPSLVGRVAAQQLGAAMVRDHPLLGVGAGNFLLVQPEYQRRNPTFTRKTLAPHNLYLQLAAESGVLGLLAWIAFFVTTVALGITSLRRRALLEPALAPLPAAALAGLAAWAFASLFLHLAEFALLVVVVGLVVSLHVRTRDLPFVPPPAPPERWFKWWAAGTAAICFLTALAGALAAVPFTQQPWRAVAYATVSVSGDNANSYEYDVAGRRTITATYAAVVQGEVDRYLRQHLESGFPVIDVDAQPTTLLLKVTAVHPDRQRSLTAARSILNISAQRIVGTDSFYRLRPLRQAVVPQQTVLLRPRVIVGGLLLALVVSGIAAGGVLVAGGVRPGARTRTAPRVP